MTNNMPVIVAPTTDTATVPRRYLSRLLEEMLPGDAGYVNSYAVLLSRADDSDSVKVWLKSGYEAVALPSNSRSIFVGRTERGYVVCLTGDTWPTPPAGTTNELLPALLPVVEVLDKPELPLDSDGPQDRQTDKEAGLVPEKLIALTRACDSIAHMPVRQAAYVRTTSVVVDEQRRCWLLGSHGYFDNYPTGGAVYAPRVDRDENGFKIWLRSELYTTDAIPSDAILAKVANDS